MSDDSAGATDRPSQLPFRAGDGWGPVSAGLAQETIGVSVSQNTQPVDVSNGPRGREPRFRRRLVEAATSGGRAQVTRQYRLHRHLDRRLDELPLRRLTCRIEIPSAAAALGRPRHP